MAEFDIAIIGAGIAGASLAAECGGHARVLLLEAEDIPGYHTTGRSAAFWEECYGGPEIVPLTLASGPYLRDHGFLSPRGALYIAREDGIAALDTFMEKFGDTGATIHRIGRAAMLEKVPGLRESWIDAVWEPLCSDIDVAGLHQHYLTLAKRLGVDLHCRARISRAERRDGAWQIASEDGRGWTATTLVNAAGAWADELAQLAGARPLGIQPLRRTICQLETDPQPLADQPLVLDIAGQFYFKPEAGRVWLSPHDEELSPPCDAAPEELAVAEAIDRFEHVVDWQVRRVERKWAGLRSFAPDRLPVYGADPHCEGLFWFAGQGGYGIQTAPAAAKLAAQLLLGLDRDDFTSGLDASLYSPARFG
ncbi:FAD-binding oxidoreductase [Erythrobacter sp. SDW2]|uniref:NAD(P)/FAD-dependent oxidoreductase n=1 Tax=Erythrobacter sp. SDW2 TaxID=2907154 RepID=UPI001F2537E2|nr:FAD-dependent oxidoreductase [Erythrobacter sp. SDW2]UIP06535.1 FAD-binding oxidoreductase [Erythrobacter sp. SDW2]